MKTLLFFQIPLPIDSDGVVLVDGLDAVAVMDRAAEVCGGLPGCSVHAGPFRNAEIGRNDQSRAYLAEYSLDVRKTVNYAKFESGVADRYFIFRSAKRRESVCKPVVPCITGCNLFAAEPDISVLLSHVDYRLPTPDIHLIPVDRNAANSEVELQRLRD